MIDPRYRVVVYEPGRHLEGCAAALCSGFHHNHWPLWEHASPRFARDFTSLMAGACDLNLVVEEAATGRALGQIFCMAPLTRRGALGAVPPLLKMAALLPTNLYFLKGTAWRHLFATVRGYTPLIRRHPTYRPHYEVMLFVCHEEVQGKGLGHALMRRAVDDMKRRGAQQVVLLTDSTMAWRFYEKFGYRRTVDVPMGEIYKIAMDSDAESGYAYELELGGS